MKALLLLLFVMVCPLSVHAQVVPLEISLDVIRQELSPAFCWFHPRMASVPRGENSPPILICTLQKHLKASDHYSGLYYMRSDDNGDTWSEPVLPPELDWRTNEDETIAVCDVTPGWHRASGRVLAIGIKLRYAATGEQLLDQPRSHQFAYASYDPQTDKWTEWKMLAMPDEESTHFLVAPGCVQWLSRPDGTLLVPIYVRSRASQQYESTVLHCSFQNDTMTFMEKGNHLALDEGRGLYEPSLAFFQGTYFLTLRNDSKAYVATSRDGLHFESPKPWTFDDGVDLGSYNTQQHWLVHNKALFLCYTRRGADNDHIPRNRAPLFLGQVDPIRKQVLRATEKILIPERGVMLGNFGAAAISPSESWVTDAEYIISDQPHPRGADGSVFAARVKWSEPNSLASVASRPRVVVLGDSITRGVRSGVSADQTFAARLQAQLKDHGQNVEVINHGIGGERTDQALRRITRDILPLQPVLVTVMYGTNDSYVDKGSATSRLSKDQYADNLKSLVSELRRHGIQVILMTEPRWGDNAGLNGAGEPPNLRLEEFMDECRSVAKEMKVMLVDHFRHWTEVNSNGVDIGTWTTDQCHPNPAGHQVLADTMLPLVIKALESTEVVSASQP